MEYYKGMLRLYSCADCRKANLIGCLLGAEPATVEKESDGIEIHRLAVAVGVHELLQLCGSLDAEENLVAILQNEEASVQDLH